MEIYVFASKNLTNIWAGVGARLWAVSQSDDGATTQGRRTKSQSMRIGSFGLLYCVETHSLTTPFIVYSKPDTKRIVENVWPESWVLPFRIFPLGTPDLQLSSDRAKRELPIFTKSGETNFGKIFHVQAVTAFSATNIEAEDWEEILRRLATETTATDFHAVGSQEATLVS
jgi:hypothetical protein